MSRIRRLPPPPTPPPRRSAPASGPACTAHQRWASTLANRSNARHRSNIRAGVSGCHIFVPAPQGIGQRLKVVILPTSAVHAQEKRPLDVCEEGVPQETS
jgi:hypothetical protein